ncbi:MAG: hypothetical protein JHC33_13825, partial [Ignisphaera sp.]|nr:hypothetical protein [Ignisphaera sp.]
MAKYFKSLMFAPVTLQTGDAVTTFLPGELRTYESLVVDDTTNPKFNKYMFDDYLQQNILCLITIIKITYVSPTSPVEDTYTYTYTLYGPTVTTFAGYWNTWDSIDGPFGVNRLNVASGMAIKNDLLYTVENDGIRKITSDGVVSYLTLPVNSNYTNTGRVIGIRDGAAQESTIDCYGNDLNIGPDGNLYFGSDSSTSSQIRKIEFNQTAPISEDMGIPPNTLFSPLDFNKFDGNLYCYNGHGIFKVDPVTKVSTLFSGSNTEFGYVDGNATTARFGTSLSLLKCSSDGSIYVADYFDNTAWHLRKIISDGSVSTLTTFTNGVSITAVDIHPITNDVYVVISGHTIYKVTQDGVTVAVAGTTQYDQPADGTGLAVKFNGISDLAFDSTGANVYITETTANVIRKMTVPEYIVTTVVGTLPSYDVYYYYGDLDGIGKSVGLRSPISLRRETDSLYFFTDSSGKIKTFNPDTNEVKTYYNSYGNISALGIQNASSIFVYWEKYGNSLGYIKNITSINTDTISLFAGHYETKGLNTTGGSKDFPECLVSPPIIPLNITISSNNSILPTVSYSSSLTVDFMYTWIDTNGNESYFINNKIYTLDGVAFSKQHKSISQSIAGNARAKKYLITIPAVFPTNAIGIKVYVMSSSFTAMSNMWHHLKTFPTTQTPGQVIEFDLVTFDVNNTTYYSHDDYLESNKQKMYRLNYVYTIAWDSQNNMWFANKVGPDYGNAIVKLLSDGQITIPCGRSGTNPAHIVDANTAMVTTWYGNIDLTANFDSTLPANNYTNLYPTVLTKPNPPILSLSSENDVYGSWSYNLPSNPTAYTGPFITTITITCLDANGMESPSSDPVTISCPLTYNPSLSNPASSWYNFDMKKVIITLPALPTGAVKWCIYRSDIKSPSNRSLFSFANDIEGICFDNNDNLYVAEYWEGSIYHIDLTTNIISSIMNTTGDRYPALANGYYLEDSLVTETWNFTVTESEEPVDLEPFISNEVTIAMTTVDTDGIESLPVFGTPTSFTMNPIIHIPALPTNAVSFKLYVTIMNGVNKEWYATYKTDTSNPLPNTNIILNRTNNSTQNYTWMNYLTNSSSYLTVERGHADVAAWGLFWNNSDNTLLIADSPSNRIVKYDPVTKYFTNLAGPGPFAYWEDWSGTRKGANDDIGYRAFIDSPSYIIKGFEANTYLVAEWNGARIMKIDMNQLTHNFTVNPEHQTEPTVITVGNYETSILMTDDGVGANWSYPELKNYYIRQYRYRILAGEEIVVELKTISNSDIWIDKYWCTSGDKVTKNDSLLPSNTIKYNGTQNQSDDNQYERHYYVNDSGSSQDLIIQIGVDLGFPARFNIAIDRIVTGVDIPHPLVWNIVNFANYNGDGFRFRPSDGRLFMTLDTTITSIDSNGLNPIVEATYPNNETWWADIDFAADGTPWLVDSWNSGKVYKIVNGVIEVVVDTGAYYFDNIVMHTDGNFYALGEDLDYKLAIYQITPAGVATKKYTGVVHGDYGGLASAPDGGIYFTENNALQKLMPNGSIITIITDKFNSAIAGGTLAEAGICTVTDIAVDNNGIIYLVNRNFNKLSIIDIPNNLVTLSIDIPNNYCYACRWHNGILYLSSQAIGKYIQ